MYSVKEAKDVVRTFIRDQWSDQKLSEVYAFNADGKMSFFRLCTCLLGVTSAETLHSERCEVPNIEIHHYHRINAELGGYAFNAEMAYERLMHPKIVRPFPNPQLAQRRMSAIMRAEMWRRSRVVSRRVEESEAIFAEVA